MRNQIGHLPRTIYGQYDNYGGQSKNRYFFAYMGFLIECDIIDVYIQHHNRVGHTHDVTKII